jgi:hypothetical protein
MRNNNLNEAEFCRQNGLKIGDVLRGVEGRCVDTVRITAIGETMVLCVWNEKREASTTFSCRDWVKIS